MLKMNAHASPNPEHGVRHQNQTSMTSNSRVMGQFGISAAILENLKFLKMLKVSRLISGGSLLWRSQRHGIQREKNFISQCTLYPSGNQTKCIYNNNT